MSGPPAACPVPISLPDRDAAMIWRAACGHDPAHRWLRETIVRLAAAS